MRKARIRQISGILLAILLILPALTAAQTDNKLAKADALIEEAGKLIDKNEMEAVEAAIVKILEARKIYEELKNPVKIRQTHGFEGFALQKIGVLYANEKKYAEAVPKLERAIRIYREIDYRQGIAFVSFSLAYVAIQQNDNEKALAFYGEALPIFRELGDDANAAKVLMLVGYIYSDKNDSTKAVENLVQASEVYKKIGDRKSQAETNSKIASIYLSDQEHKKAADHFLEALSAYRELKDDVNLALTFHNLGFVFGHLKENEEALTYYEQANLAYQKTGNFDGQFSVLRNSGLTAHDLKNYPKAVEYFKSAMAIKDKIQNRKTIADLYSNLGNSYASLPDGEKSAAAYEEAVNIRRELAQTDELINELNNAAFANAVIFNWNKSNGFYEETILLGEREKKASSQIFALLGLRRNYFVLNRVADAENYLNRAVALLDKLIAEMTKGAEFLEVGRGFSGQKKYDEAIVYFRKALAEFESDGSKFNQMLALNDIGSTQLALENYELAADYFRQAQAIAVETDDEIFQIQSYFNLGDAKYSDNRFEESLEFYETGLKKAIQRVGAATAKTQPRQSAGGMNDSMRSSIFKSFNTNSLKKGVNADYVRMLMIGFFKVGGARHEMGEYKTSLEMFEKSLEIARNLISKYDEMSALTAIASSNVEMGNYNRNIESNQKALIISRTIKDLYSESLILNNIGIAYLRLGSLEKAEDFVQQSAKIVETLNDPRLSAQAEGNLGAVYARLKQYDKALRYFELAIPKFRAQRNDKFTIVISYYYGTVLRETGDVKRAVEVHKESAELAAKTSAPKFGSRALSELGLDYIALKDYEKAISVFEQALALGQTAEAKDEQAAAFDGLMQAYSALGKNGAAIFYGKQSINILQTIRGDTEKIDKDVQANFLKDNKAIYRRLADLLIAEGRLPEAQQVLAMLKEKEYSEFLSRDSDEIKNLAQIVQRPDEKEVLEKYAEYSKTLASDGKELAELEAKKNKLKEGEAFAEKARYDDLKKRIESANKAFRIFLEKTLALEIDESKVNAIKQDRALQGKLANWGEGTVALYTVIGEDRYRVILTTPKTQIDGKKEIKSADLNKKISDFRQVLLDRTLDPRPLGKELYDVLIKPIEADLEKAGAKTLLWTLDGSLAYIPIGALFDGEEYFAEKYQNVIVTSVTRASLDADTNKDWHILGAGVTNASEVAEPFGTEKIPFTALPGVGAELNTIVQNPSSKGGGILPGLRLVDKDFTEDALKENVSKRDAGERTFNVIHFATHFRLGSLAENSFLLLGNNQILTLEEVNDSSDLDLTGIELVTLSACNTGFGGITNVSADNKSVDSLAKFIEGRGAKSVIASLWAVEDESTSLLMSEFYRLRKANPNMSKAEAMQTAQKLLISGELKPSGESKDDRSGVRTKNENAPNAPKFVVDPKKPFAHPIFWSPFILIGNWR